MKTETLTAKTVKQRLSDILFDILVNVKSFAENKNN